MKIFVHFKPNEKYDNFEGARLRKTIKSALEVVGIPYTDTVMDNFDIAHLISYEDDGLIDELKEKGVPIVVSALYSEDDPSSSYIEYKNKDGNRIYTIKPKAIKFLNNVDLVLTPNEIAKQILISNGVTTRIKICPPSVNSVRFDFSRDDEKTIFYRYFGCESDKKIVVCLGHYNGELDGLSVILSAAKVCEDVNFYYIAATEGGMRYKKIVKGLPKNVFVSPIVPDDVYRSALLNADVFLLPGYKTPGVLSVCEAMAAKCQLIVRKHDILQDIAIDQKTAYVASYSETLAGIIKDYFEGKMQPTIEEAYNIASQNDIGVFGDNLIRFYQSVIR
ncbi:MAG: glycosyltransferase [Bacilli bacterium]|nr:glycosyltransferase [Bacilli bacterium]